MNFYDPRTYADATNSLSPLAADERVSLVKSVFLYDDGQIEVAYRPVRLGQVDILLSTADRDFDDYDYYPIDTDELRIDATGDICDEGNVLAYAIDCGRKEHPISGAPLRRAIIEMLQAKTLGIRIGKFQICQLYVHTVSILPDGDCFRGCTEEHGSRRVREEGTFLYTN